MGSTVVNELMDALGERGTLLAPEAAEALRSDEALLAEAQRILLDSKDLPFILTLDDFSRLGLANGDALSPSGNGHAPRPPAAAASEDPAPHPLDAVRSPVYPRVNELPPPPPPEDAAALVREAEEALERDDPDEVAPARIRPDAPVPFTPDQRGGGSEIAAGAGAHLLAEPEAPPRGAPGLARAQASARRWTPPDPESIPKGLYEHAANILADVTGQSTCEGALTDFTKYFNDRLSKIRKILRQRRELVGNVPIKNIRAGLAEIKVIGIVTEVRSTKNGHRLIELEDETGACNVLAPANSPHLVSEADTVIEDEVVGVVCRPASKGSLLILDRLVRPDVPLGKETRRSNRGSAVAFVSDIHIGSKTFLHEDWDRFTRWITGEWGDSRMKALAQKVKYLVANGDIVDGVGMFPGQEDELAILDGAAQYRCAADEFNRIQEARPDLKVFMLPGNHDLVRPAEPQPALPDKYKKMFDPRIVQVGNPCKVEIEGVEILGYHGRSMDDWITRVQGLSYEKPIDAMREMVQRRHMVPVYGLRTPIAPEHRDYMVIETVPDVFVTGHVHSAGFEEYRGITLLNASCWQAQTSYQKMHGFIPEPGKIPIVELDTRQTLMMDFHRGPSGVQAGLQGRGGV